MNKRLKINKLKVDGKLQFTQNFRDGVNFITGGNSLGKTNILKTIQYGLGGKDPDFAPEISNNCANVYLEIQINNEIITIVREIKRFGARIKVFFKALDKIGVHDKDYEYYNPDEEFSRLMFNKLELNEIRYYRSGAPKIDGSMVRLSFKELFRYFYIQQKIGYGELLSKQPERPRKKAFEQLLNLHRSDLNELENKKIFSQANKMKLNQEKNRLISIFKELEMDPNININRSIQDLEDKIKGYKEKRDEIRSSSKKIITDKVLGKVGGGRLLYPSILPTGISYNPSKIRVATYRKMTE
ncbi:hypothetical protein LCGC14_3149540, partial [marine sediment metagenome]